MICLALASGLVMAQLAGDAFTLSWRHSVEKIEWQEDWQAEGGRLHLTEARIQGSGAGMEPPPEAVLEQGWWRYRPDLWLAELTLARSAFTRDYDLCRDGACRSLSDLVPLDAGPVTVLRPCATEGR